MKIGFRDTTALVGSVLALSFGLSLLGGFLGDHYIRYKSLFLLSVIFQAIGCLVFSTDNYSYILWLSGVFLLGSIGNTIAVNMMLTKLFKSQDCQREKSFFALYMCLNLGYLIGYSLSGHFGNQNEYSNLPFIILVTSGLTLLVILMYWKKLDIDNKIKKNHPIKTIGIFFGTLLILRLLLSHPYLTNFLLITFWAGMAIFMYIKITKDFPNKADEIKLFYVLLLAALVFWSVYFLAPMALMIFIKNHVNLKVGSFFIAPQWIQNINTIVVIVGSIWFSFNIKENSGNYLKKQFAKGLLLIGLGFFSLVIGIILTSKYALTHISILWIALSYVLQSSGELFIGPIGYSLVGRLVPQRHQGIMTGIWATILGVASAIASYLSSILLNSGENLNPTLNQFNYLFIAMTLLSIIVSILLFSRKDFLLPKS